MLRIPTFQTLSADFTQTSELGNYVMRLRFTYNARNGFFRLNFTDANNITIYGIKVVPNYLLIGPHKTYIEFEGDIVILKDDKSIGNILTYENFCGRWSFPASTTDSC